MQVGAKYNLVELVAALKPTDTTVNVSCCKPTATELFSSVYHSSDNLVSLFLYSVSLQEVIDGIHKQPE